MGKSVENGQLTLISMGQGQEGPAEAVLDKYTKEGGWVFLDNVHLMQVSPGSASVQAGGCMQASTQAWRKLSRAAASRAPQVRGPAVRWAEQAGRCRHRAGLDPPA